MNETKSSIFDIKSLLVDDFWLVYYILPALSIYRWLVAWIVQLDRTGPS